jgi:hypothetical protein
MNTNDVKVGVPFYVVLALGEGSFIEKYIPTSKPREHQITENYSSVFVECKKYYGNGDSYDCDISLSDSGIIPNTYNHHESFLSEKTAKYHLKLVKKFSD